MSQKLMIIDTDCGIDDAQAIMLALASTNVKVLGITCCFGNTDVDNVCQNVLRVLSVCHRTEMNKNIFQWLYSNPVLGALGLEWEYTVNGALIPVFRGAASCLIGAGQPFKNHFGTDGLGDVLHNKDSDTWRTQIQKELAVTSLVRLVNEYPGQVSLVALGPLTNLALAVKTDPSISQNLKELYIMGGNIEGKGNMTPCAEFNFYMDPESAYIVLEEYLCPTHIASWEFTCRNKLSWEFFDELIGQDTAAARFMKLITSKCWAFSREHGTNARDIIFGSGFVPYDAYAVAACVDSSVITETMKCGVRVETEGALGRGMMALDFTGKLKSHHVFLMKTCNLTKFTAMLMASLQQP